MQNGIIIKGIGGFYYVDIGSDVIECKAQGHFRKENIVPFVGDKVDIDVDLNTGKGSICRIHDRKNVFIRPPVSNIDGLVIVVACQNPAPDLGFLDKMLVISQSSNVQTFICFNKSDLDPDVAANLEEIYRKIGYNTAVTSTMTNDGLHRVKNFLDSGTTAFCGFSGVGKSSMLNSVMGKEIMQTGEVSERLRRGRHTTRHVELIKYGNGYIVDTPGFSMLDFPNTVTKNSLAGFFPEFSEYVEDCKFRDCTHIAASSVCAVSNAVEKNMIAASRYENYKDFFATLSQRKEWKK